MSADLQFLEEWIPERMDPGTVFVLENQAKLGHAQNPYVAVMSCPRCGTMGLITHRQLYAGDAMIAAAEACSAEYRLDGDNICFRPVQLSCRDARTASTPTLPSAPQPCRLNYGRNRVSPRARMAKLADAADLKS